MKNNIFDKNEMFSPYKVRAISHLYGVDGTPVKYSRILDLGCGRGLHWLSYCLAHPHSYVIGIDIREELISEGDDWLKSEPIENLNLFNLDINQLLSSDLDDFDYIFIGGIFRFIPMEAKNALIEFAKKHLAENGILCYSYPCLPGWKINETIRDAMLFHSSLSGNIDDRIIASRGLLNLFKEGLNKESYYTQELNSLAEDLEHASDSDFALAYLEGTNEPAYFIDIATSSQKLGLDYVGDYDLPKESPEWVGKKASELWESLGLNKNKILSQQYLDFLNGRSFRTSIFTHINKKTPVLIDPQYERLKYFRWASEAQRAISPKTGKISKIFIDALGGTYSIDDDIAVSILDALGSIWPRSLSFSELIKIIEHPRYNIFADKKIEFEKNTLNNLIFLINQGFPLIFTIDEEPAILDNQDNLLIPSALRRYIRDFSRNGENKADIFNFWCRPAQIVLTDNDCNALDLLNGNNKIISIYKDGFREDGFDELKCINKKLEIVNPNDINSSTFKFCRFFEHVRAQGIVFGGLDAWISFYGFSVYLKSYKWESAYYDVTRQLFLIILFNIKKKNKSKYHDFIFLSDKDLKRKISYRQKILNILNQTDSFNKKNNLDERFKYLINISNEYPYDENIWNRLGGSYLNSSQPRKSIKSFLRAIALEPINESNYTNFATALRVLSHHVAAEIIYKLINILNPDLAHSWDGLSNIEGFFSASEREAFSRRAVKLEPNNTIYLSNLGRICSLNQKSDESELLYRRCVKLEPNNLLYRSNLLFVLAHSEKISPENLYLEHVKYGEILEGFSGSLKYKNKYNNEINKKIKIGFVSGDFRNHPVANFIEPIWHYLDKSKFEIYAYSNSYIEDFVTETLRKFVDGWRPIAGISDRKVAELISDDHIDILFDLSGHTSDNRLPVFALKPAPVQISWIGYPGTTGLTRMDYRLVYQSLGLNQISKYFTEKLILIPGTIRFDPGKDCPDVNNLPALTNRYITFGSFNRVQKINSKSIELWAQILLAVPNSKIIVANMPDDNIINYIDEGFSKEGISKDRISYRKRATIREYLAMHHEIDIHLDTFPYGGGTTTNYAAWMGIPVLTLEGDTLTSRNGAVLMRQFGLDNFIASSPEDLLRKAILVSQDFEALNSIRRNLRSVVEKSRLSDHRPTYYFEKALLECWHRWCLNMPIDHIIINDDRMV
jgi:predicted O-linked N-acetylglucosamine transferase (SPINDLY family)/SAM-dependent methyltransferase